MTVGVRADIDDQTCVGTGLCEATAPDLFEVTEEGHARVLVAHVPDDRVEAARRAAADCPTRALSVSGD